MRICCFCLLNFWNNDTSDFGVAYDKILSRYLTFCLISVLPIWHSNIPSSKLILFFRFLLLISIRVVRVPFSVCYQHCSWKIPNTPISNCCTKKKNIFQHTPIQRSFHSPFNHIEYKAHHWKKKNRDAIQFHLPALQWRMTVFHSYAHTYMLHSCSDFHSIKWYYRVSVNAYLNVSSVALTKMIATFPLDNVLCKYSQISKLKVLIHTPCAVRHFHVV